MNFILLKDEQMSYHDALSNVHKKLQINHH